MNKGTVIVLAAVFIAITVIMSGLFVYEFSVAGKQNTSYKEIQSSYESQQQSVVLNNAFSHWDYIAIENSSLLAPQYMGNATLTWIGGPLTGTYHGVSNITAVWNRFFGLWSAVWYYTVSPPVASVSGSSARVVSENQFVLTPYSNPDQAQYLNISYSLTYMFNDGNWSILSETWHIIGSGFISPAQQFVLSNYIGDLAFSHWNNIAIENNTTVMEQYDSNATLHWIGGPLNGTYSGISQINSTWNRFFGLWSAVWFYSEAPPAITVSDNIANVSADVQFVVQDAANQSVFKYINVSYNILYYDTGFSSASGMPTYLIYSETFQITGSNVLSKL